MMLFYQMYRLAAEPFFLSNFKKSDFVQMLSLIHISYDSVR